MHKTSYPKEKKYYQVQCTYIKANKLPTFHHEENFNIWYIHTTFNFWSHYKSEIRGDYRTRTYLHQRTRTLLTFALCMTWNKRSDMKARASEVGQGWPPRNHLRENCAIYMDTLHSFSYVTMMVFRQVILGLPHMHSSISSYKTTLPLVKSSSFHTI